ncbi:MAG: ABC transporter ATP-binding protein [Fervidobacterium sp.]|nr:ABC transporter ATP-binding protein [Fervidobacterium sp.]
MINLIPIISIKDLSFSYGNNFSLENITLSIEKGTFFGIIGPNGSGKTTLLSLVLKFLKPHSGAIFINGENIQNLSHKKIAKNIAYIAQDFNPVYDFTVEEIVEMGAIARTKSFFDSDIDPSEVDNALKIVDLLDYKKRLFSTLSGGQQRRTLIARAVYQNTPIIVADELTNHLDIGQALKVMGYLKSLTLMGKTVVGTFHDITLAAKYCDYIAIMKDGKIQEKGTPRQIIREDVIKEIYNINVKIIRHPDDDYPVVII